MREIDIRRFLKTASILLALLLAAGEPGGWADGAVAFWCLGWIYFRSALGECYCHVGAEEGFENFDVFFPERRAALVILSSGPSPNGVARAAIEGVFGTTGIPFAWMGYQ